MKVSRERVTENRDRTIDVAGRFSNQRAEAGPRPLERSPAENPLR